MKNLNYRLGLFFLFTGILSLGKARAQNLVTNGTFTAGNTGWTFFAPATTAEVMAENVYGGTTTNLTAEIDNGSNFRQINIPVTPGETYNLSFKCTRRTAGGAGFSLPPIPCTINAKVYNGAAVFLNQNVSSSNTVFNLQCQNYQFTPTTATVTLDLANVNNPSTLGMIMDDITITPVNQVINFSGQSCVGGDFTLTAPASTAPNAVYTNYQWTGPNGFTATGQTATVTNAPLAAAGTYTCTMTLNGCVQVTGQFAITLSTTATNDIAYICEGDSINIFGQFVHTAGTFDSTFQNINGCDSVSTITVNVMPSPGKILAPDSLIVCQYDTVRLETSTNPINPNFSYSWTPSTGLNSTTDPNVWFIADQSRNYTLRVSAPDPNLTCWMEHTIHVIVNPGDFLNLNLNEAAICPGNSVQLTATGAQQYSWSPALYVDNTSSATPLITPVTSGTYTVIGTSDKGCTDTQQVQITVHPAAVLSLPDVVNIYSGEQYFMEPATNAVHFTWFPDAGLNSAHVSNPVMSPEVNTRYFVVATTENGCTVSDSVDILVMNTAIDMPNAFVPGNGSFKVVKRGIAALNAFKIFNRWGEEIFSTTDIEHGWDGTWQGKPQGAGVYVYQIDARTAEGKPFKKQGTVTLLR
jgi:gliding motility-associated-like protein